MEKKVWLVEERVQPWVGNRLEKKKKRSKRDLMVLNRESHIS